MPQSGSRRKSRPSGGRLQYSLLSQVPGPLPVINPAHTPAFLVGFRQHQRGDGWQGLRGERISLGVRTLKGAPPGRCLRVTGLPHGSCSLLLPPCPPHSGSGLRSPDALSCFRKVSQGSESNEARSRREELAHWGLAWGGGAVPDWLRDREIRAAFSEQGENWGAGGAAALKGCNRLQELALSPPPIGKSPMGPPPSRCSRRVQPASFQAPSGSPQTRAHLDLTKGQPEGTLSPLRGAHLSTSMSSTKVGRGPRPHQTDLPEGQAHKKPRQGTPTTSCSHDDAEGEAGAVVRRGEPRFGDICTDTRTLTRASSGPLRPCRDGGGGHVLEEHRREGRV